MNLPDTRTIVTDAEIIPIKYISSLCQLFTAVYTRVLKTSALYPRHYDDSCLLLSDLHVVFHKPRLILKIDWFRNCVVLSS